MSLLRLVGVLDPRTRLPGPLFGGEPGERIVCVASGDRLATFAETTGLHCGEYEVGDRSERVERVDLGDLLMLCCTCSSVSSLLT